MIMLDLRHGDEILKHNCVVSKQCATADEEALVFVSGGPRQSLDKFMAPLVLNIDHFQLYRNKGEPTL